MINAERSAGRGLRVDRNLVIVIAAAQRDAKGDANQQKRQDAARGSGLLFNDGGGFFDDNDGAAGMRKRGGQQHRGSEDRRKDVFHDISMGQGSRRWTRQPYGEWYAFDLVQTNGIAGSEHRRPRSMAIGLAPVATQTASVASVEA
jgi:hypothetical protein